MTSGGNNFSRTFHDLKLQFPGLSWNFKEKNSGLSRKRGNPAITMPAVLVTGTMVTLNLLFTSPAVALQKCY